MVLQSEIDIEILQYSYWEHFKKAKDLALVFTPEHRKRIELEAVLNDISDKLKKQTNQKPLNFTY